MRWILLILIALPACSSDIFIASQGDVDEAIELFQEGRYEEALAAYDALQSRNPRVAFDRGLCLFQLKRWEEAIKAFDEMRESKDQHMKALSYYHIGNVHSMQALDAEAAGLGEDALPSWKLAVEAYENCLLIDPDHEDATYQLEIALFRVDPPCSLRNDALEPNNLFAEARPAELQPVQEEDAAPGERGLEQALWLCPVDEDWLTVKLEPGDRFEAIVSKTEGPAHAKAALELWPPDGRTMVAPQGEDSVQKIELPSLAEGGEYRVRVANPQADDFGVSLKLKVRPACLRTEDEHEPNDSQAAATEVEAGDVGPLRMCPGAHDWFAVQVAQGESLKVDAEVKAQSGTLSIVLMDAEGAVIGEGVAEGKKGSVSALAYGRPAGKVWIHVEGSEDAEAVYQLKLELIPVCAEREDDYEENDTWESARALSPGDHEGLQLCPGDADVFQVSVKAGESIVAHLSPEEVLLGTPQIEVLDASGKVMLGGFNLRGGRMAQALAPGEGTYYLRVADVEGRPADAKYTLRFEILPPCPEGNDKDEENDVATDATMLELPPPPQGAGGQDEQPPRPKQKLLRICPGDMDWFRIPITPETPLMQASIEFIHDKGDLRLIAYEADGETRAGESDKSSTERNFEGVVVPPADARIPDPTDYLLKVDGVEADTENFYMLSLKQLPPSGKDEQEDDSSDSEEDNEDENNDEQQKPEEQQRPDRSTLEKEMESEDKNPRNLEAERARARSRHLPPPRKDW